MDRVSVVIATRDRRDRLLATIARLETLPERPAIVVVDDGSTDGTPEAVRRHHPDVTVAAADRRAGMSPRTQGARLVGTPYVAFNDDDSWWAPGALTRACELFEAHPGLGLIAARILVEPAGDLDPTCQEMERSPLAGDADLPGPPVLGFLACGAVVRRSALLDCGGFAGELGFGGEEQLLSIDLAAAGWGLAYVGEVVAHHEPSRGARPARERLERRNDLLTAWLRRPPSAVLSRTARVMTGGGTAGWLALLDAARALPWVLSERRVVPPHVERALRRLERRPAPSVALAAARGA